MLESADVSIVQNGPTPEVYIWSVRSASPYDSIHWHVHEVSRKWESCSHGLDGDIDGRTGSQNCNECGFTTPKMTQTLLVLFGSPHDYPLFESYQSIQ